jgi:hypothetical protein
MNSLIVRASFLFLVVFIVWALPAHSVLAHGQATSLQKVVGNYLLEFEYNQTGNPPAGDFIAYNFDILDVHTQEFLTFKSAFVRFASSDDKKTFANGTLTPDQFTPSNARMGVSLPEAGRYAITARFYDNDDAEIAEATFDLTVDPPYSDRGFVSSAGSYAWVIALIIGLIIGLAAARFLHFSGKNDNAE